MTLAAKLLCLLPLATPAAPAPGGEHAEEGAAAPAGAWTTRGGAPSHAGVARTRGLAAPPEPAWTFRARGVLEGEPLAWGERVVVFARESSLRRSVHVLDLASGRPRFAAALPAPLALEPSLWEDLLAVRPDERRVELYRVGDRRLEPLRSIETEAPAAAPLLHGDELYVLAGSELVRHDVRRREPVWRLRLPGVFRGRAALRGGHVFAVRYDGRGGSHLVSVRRADGEVVSQAPLARHAGEPPGPRAELDVVVLADEVFVRLPRPVEADVPGSFSSVRVGREGGRLSSVVAGATASSLHDFDVAPVELGDGWIVRDRPPGRSAPRWAVSTTEGAHTRSVVLADEERHAELLDAPAPAARGADVLFLDGLGVDPHDYRILWRSGLRPLRRPVPVTDAVLVVAGADELVALRPRERPREGPAIEEARRLARRSEAELGDALAGLVLRALRTGDAELPAALLAEAEERGASERALERAAAAIERVERAGRGLRRDARGVRAVEAERERLRGALPGKLLAHARGTRDPGLARALLAQVLERAPGHPGAAEAVRDLLPADAPAESSPAEPSPAEPSNGEPFDARSWLEFLEVAAQTPVRFVAPGPGTGPPDGDGARVLAREARLWRPDVRGWASERLFVVAPPGRPGAVARCLEVGELVCDALEELFEVEAVGGERPRLVLLLYGSADEYHAESQREGSRPELARGWTGGHYSPSENLSRMFVPADDEGARRLLDVYAHELAHHWLATRAPFSVRTGWRARADQAGYWVVEGFASMVEEFRLDPAAGTWDPVNARAESLDLVAGARPEDMLPWDVFFRTTSGEFHELSPEPAVELPLAWRLGAHARVSPLRLFYAQAGAACHWLLRAEDGRRRPALLRALADFHAGRPVDAEAAFGLPAAELGRRIVAFARESVTGS